MSDTAFLIIGIIIALLGTLLAYFRVKHRISCSKKITATVRSVEKKSYERRGRTRYEYLPVFSYSVNGKNYTSKGGKTFWNKEKYKIGNEYEIRYDPNSPDKISNGISVFSLFCDFLLIAFGTVIIFCYFI